MIRKKILLSELVITELWTSQCLINNNIYLLIDVIEDRDEEVYDKDVGTEEVEGHGHRRHPPTQTNTIKSKDFKCGPYNVIVAIAVTVAEILEDVLLTSQDDTAPAGSRPRPHHTHHKPCHLLRVNMISQIKNELFYRNNSEFQHKIIKDLSIHQNDVIFLSPDFLRKLRWFSKSFAYVGSVVKGNIG